MDCPLLFSYQYKDVKFTSLTASKTCVDLYLAQNAQQHEDCMTEELALRYGADDLVLREVSYR